jgi:putative CocE/NonD family hydrolase
VPQEYMVSDQRFAASRPDVLVYRSEVLDDDVTIAGPVTPRLFVSTTGTDADWVVKLIDVYPKETPEGASQGSKQDMSGFELPIGIEIFRGRYVDSFAQPHALTPGKVTEYKWGLPNVNHVFLPGHRIMVQVQSSLFPLYDRNPQSFVPNIFNAKAGDYRAATQSVFTGGNTASAVYLPIVP